MVATHNEESIMHAAGALLGGAATVPPRQVAFCLQSAYHAVVALVRTVFSLTTYGCSLTTYGCSLTTNGCSSLRTVAASPRTVAASLLTVAGRLRPAARHGRPPDLCARRARPQGLQVRAVGQRGRGRALPPPPHHRERRRDEWRTRAARNDASRARPPHLLGPFRSGRVSGRAE